MRVLNFEQPLYPHSEVRLKDNLPLCTFPSWRSLMHSKVTGPTVLSTVGLMEFVTLSVGTPYGPTVLSTVGPMVQHSPGTRVS